MRLCVRLCIASSDKAWISRPDGAGIKKSIKSHGFQVPRLQFQSVTSLKTTWFCCRGIFNESLNLELGGSKSGK